MVFITVGSQKFQFNRLLIAVDNLVETGILSDYEVYAQTGYCDYKPKNYRFSQFLNREEFESNVLKTDILLTHGGTGAIVNGLKNRKKVIAVPRLAKYGEHVDDHQIEIVTQFVELNLICGVFDCDKLDKALSYTNDHVFNVYQSNADVIINDLDKYISESDRGE